MRIVSLVILLLGVTISSSTLAASFDCAKASTKVERTICEDVELSSLDEDMANIYRVAIEKSNNPEELKKTQSDWIAGNKKNCNLVCLRKRYESRIFVLSKEIDSLDESKVHEPIHPWRYIASGDEHTCVASDHEIKCWGENKYGAFNFSKKFEGITQLQSISSAHICVKEREGWSCFGSCPNNLCNIGSELKYANKLVSSYNHLCAIVSKELFCQGDDGIDKWPKLSNLTNVVDVALGDENACAVLDNGVVRCWGENHNNQVVEAEALGGAVSIFIGGRNTCIFNMNGKLLCSKIPEKLGMFPNFGQSDVPEDEEFSFVALGRFHVCGITKNNSIRCWGNNANFQSKPPVLNKNEKPFAISSGSSHSCVITTQRVLCWGVYELESYLRPSSANALAKKSLQY